MEAVDFVYTPAKKFVDDCRRVLKRCTLPSGKVIKKTALATGVGFAILGTVGFVFKLVSLPINNALIGGMMRK
ncbi:Protein transport protein Sec61 subunit gamma [Tritrichomonas foetus]|uniref:Protein transport protein Sec61 subunit gamma n=1 Tax=Tritrichomonas foetus TaxID=1144522 RepID=A0A1J4KLN6_9EUKA|nr:Protein transport protein Sec61 subunit gamma [Tritrichomonas foetus]|eukprot:OHT12223.1 Protein transport protein Sec61 subunit gamma [Tritrichomonas foetus]